jgi:hypothetical protein
VTSDPAVARSWRLLWQRQSPAMARLGTLQANPGETTLAWLDLDLVSYENTSSTRTVIMLADLRASLQAVTAYMLALFAVAALPGYLLATVGN